MDAVEREFRAHIVPELPGARDGYSGTDEDLSVREGDHVGRPVDIEKLAVDPGHRPTADNRALDPAEFKKGASKPRCDLHAHGQGCCCKQNEPAVVVADQPLP